MLCARADTAVFLCCFACDANDGTIQANDTDAQKTSFDHNAMKDQVSRTVGLLASEMLHNVRMAGLVKLPHSIGAVGRRLLWAVRQTLPKPAFCASLPSVAHAASGTAAV